MACLPGRSRISAPVLALIVACLAPPAGAQLADPELVVGCSATLSSDTFVIDSDGTFGVVGADPEGGPGGTNFGLAAKPLLGLEWTCTIFGVAQPGGYEVTFDTQLGDDGAAVNIGPVLETGGSLRFDYTVDYTVDPDCTQPPATADVLLGVSLRTEVPFFEFRIASPFQPASFGGNATSVVSEGPVQQLTNVLTLNLDAFVMPQDNPPDIGIGCSPDPSCTTTDVVARTVSLGTTRQVLLGVDSDFDVFRGEVRTRVTTGTTVTIDPNDPNAACLSVTRSPPVLQNDSDGILDSIEDGVNLAKDGNGDFIDDSSQRHVASLPNGEDGRYVTLAAPLGTTLSRVSSAGTPAVAFGRCELDRNTSCQINADCPGTTSCLSVCQWEPNTICTSGADCPGGPCLIPRFFPTGVTNFTVTGFGGLDTIVEVHLAPGTPLPASYYKLDPADPGQYAPFVYDPTMGLFDGAETPLGNPVILHLRDGGRGDRDGVVNGTIVDPGGPVGLPEPGVGVLLVTALATVAGLRRRSDRRSGAPTKKAAVTAALQEFIARRE